MPETEFMTSSIGKKVIVAITGLLLIGFIIAHLIGNLALFGGSEMINNYASHLDHLEPLLWVARVILLIAVGLHIGTSVILARENRAARPVVYKKYQTSKTTLAARTMMLSGLLILAFLVYHLLHFTFRVTNPDISHFIDSQGRRDVYAMVVLSFKQKPIAISYLVAMFFLAAHLSHGFSSVFQTLGFNNEAWQPRLKMLGHLFAALILLGYMSIPLSVWFGVLRMKGAGL